MKALVARSWVVELRLVAFLTGAIKELPGVMNVTQATVHRFAFPVGDDHALVGKTRQKKGITSYSGQKVTQEKNEQKNRKTRNKGQAASR